jgi:MFS family permease
VDAAGNSDQTFDRAYANRTLALLALIPALIIYVDTMLTPALPRISAEYGVSIAQTSLLISLYVVFGVAVMPIIGKLGDIYGKKRLMIYTLSAYLIVSTTTSLAPSFGLIVASRFFQGIGLGAIPLSFSLAREQFPRDMVPRAQGLISAIQISGAAAGLLVGALVTSAYRWQGNYYLVLPVILLLTVLTAFTVRESTNLKPGVRLDYVGAGCLGASLTTIVLGLSEGASWGWESPAVLALLLGGLAVIFPLTWYERRLTEPVLDLKLLRRRNVLVANLMILVCGISTYMMFQAFSYFMQLPPPSGFGLDIVQTGLSLLPLVIVGLPVAYAVGVVIPRYGVKPFLYLGAAVAAIGFLLLSISTSPVEVAAYLMVYAVGSGFIMVSMQNLLVLSLERGEMGLGTALNSAFRYIGQSLGAPLSGAILSTVVSTSVVAGRVLVLPTRDAFRYCFYSAAALFLVVGATAVLAKEVIGRDSNTEVAGTPGSRDARES